MLNNIENKKNLHIFFYGLTLLNLFILTLKNPITDFLFYYLPIELIQLANILLFFHIQKNLKKRIIKYSLFKIFIKVTVFFFFIFYILFVFFSFTYILPIIILFALIWLNNFTINKNKFFSFMLSGVFLCLSLFYLHPEHGNNIFAFKILSTISLAMLFYHFSELKLFKNLKADKFLKKSLNYFNFLSIILIFWWFVKEIFNIGIQFEFNFIYNLLVLFIAINAVFLNKNICKQKVFDIARNHLSFKKDWLVIFPILFFLVPMMMVVNWDLPYHFHPGDDEYVIPAAYLAQGDFSEALNNPNTSQNPLFDNQHLMYYILTPFFYFFKQFGFSFYGEHAELFANYFLLARLLNYLFAISIIFLTYLSGKILFDKKTALLAAFVIATGKIFMHFSLFMRSDMILTFFVLLIFLYLALNQKHKYENLILSGAIIGLGLSLKPYMLIFGGLLVIFHAIKKLTNKDFASFFADSAAFSSSLLLFFHFGRFYNHFIHQDLGAGFYNAIEHATTGHYGLFPSADANTFFFSFELLSWWMGIVFTIIFILSIFFSIANFKKTEFRLLFAFIVPAYLYFSSNIVQGAKFYLVLLPAISILIAVMLVYFFRLKSIIIKSATIIVIIIFFSQYLFLSLGKISIISKNKDVRVLAENWIIKNIKQYSNIALLGSEKSQFPQIDKNKYLIDKKTSQDTQYLILPKSSFHTLEYYMNNPKSYDQNDWFPSVPPSETEIETAKNIVSGKILAINGQNFKRIKTIKKEQTFLGLPYDEYFPHPASWELWSVNNPKEIIIYEKISN